MNPVSVSGSGLNSVRQKHLAVASLLEQGPRNPTAADHAAFLSAAAAAAAANPFGLSFLGPAGQNLARLSLNAAAKNPACYLAQQWPNLIPTDRFGLNSLTNPAPVVSHSAPNPAPVISHTSQVNGANGAFHNGACPNGATGAYQNGAYQNGSCPNGAFQNGAFSAYQNGAAGAHSSQSPKRPLEQDDDQPLNLSKKPAPGAGATQLPPFDSVRSSLIKSTACVS